MRTIEQVKKDKNYLAHGKGYPIDPEGFSLYFLMSRLWDEYQELIEAVKLNRESDAIIDELADMSNIIDYIATKIITKYPDRHLWNSDKQRTMERSK